MHRLTHTEMTLALWAVPVALVLIGEGLDFFGLLHRAGRLRSAGLSCLAGAGLFYLI